MQPYAQLGDKSLMQSWDRTGFTFSTHVYLSFLYFLSFPFFFSPHGSSPGLTVAEPRIATRNSAHNSGSWPWT
jgi:hypothetical protein